MLKSILSRPVTVIMIFTAVAVFGIISYRNLPVNLLPDIKYPSLTVWTELPGSSPEQVERLVTEPLEASIAGLRDIISMRSESKEAISLITIDFAWGTDMDFAVLYLREKLDAANLPDNSGRPNIMRIDPASKPIMILSVSGTDQRSVREVTEHIIKKRMEQIEGVAMADVIGGEEQDIRIEADVDKMNYFGISFSTLGNAVRSASVNSPGGTVRDDVYIYDLVISSEFADLKDIEDTLVRQLPNRRNVYVKDIATVSYRTKEKRSFTRFNSEPSTAVMIRKDGDANAVLVADRVKETIEDLNRSLAVGIHIVYDQSDFITESIRNVVSAILLGGLLSFLTLFLFLREFKAPFNISLAMPISIFSTFTLLHFSKTSLNLMSLSGFALGIGMLVDNSIVVLENIDRHKKSASGIFEACYKGVREVVMPVTASTLTTIIVFMPVVFVSGVAGELFKDQSLSVAFALVSSLFVAVTLVPVLYHKLSLDKKPALNDISIGPDNGPLFKTGIYWTFLVLGAYFIVRLSKIPVDGHTFAYILFLSLAADPMVKTAEYFIFRRKDTAGTYLKKIRVLSVSLLWFMVVIIPVLPAVYISRINFFEPVHVFISSFSINSLYGLDAYLYNLTSALYEIFQPYEEELGTKTFMLYAYLLGGAVFLVNLLGLFSPANLYGMEKDSWRKMFYSEGLRNIIKRSFLICVGFIAGLIMFYYRSAITFIKFVFKPVLKGFDRVYSAFEKMYHKILVAALDNKSLSFAVFILLLSISGLVLFNIERRMMPDVDSHEFILSVEMNPGTGILTLEKVVGDYEEIIKGTEGVISVFSTGGIFDEKSLLTGAAVYKSDIQVKIENNIPTASFVNALRNKIEAYNSESIFNIRTSFNTDVSVLGEMLKTDEGDISVKIFGNNISELRNVSENVKDVLRGFENLSEINSDFSGSRPQMVIRFRNHFLEANNISEQEITSFIRTLISGDITSQITESNRQTDIIVGAGEKYSENIRNLLGAVYMKGGTAYPLSRLIEVDYETGPESVKRESQVRVVTVTAALTGGRLDRTMEEVSRAVGNIDLYRSMRIETGGQNTEMQESMNQIIFMFLLSLILVYMVLASQFESLLSPFIIVLSVPLASTGVAFGLLLTGQSVNILSGIGMIMLIGIVVNDAIVKVDFIDNGVRSGLSVRDAILDASRKRLRPILMTTVSTVCGMLPMAVAFGGSSELRRPLAVTVIFGLSAATMLILVFLPVIYETLKRRKNV